MSSTAPGSTARRAGARFLLPVLLAVASASAQDGWGYPLDSLEADLARWSASPFVRTDTFGTSVQGRPLVVLEVHDSTISDTSSPAPKARIVVHARTHPWEVQSAWVVREMVRFLVGGDDSAASMRRRFVFDVVPSINPDGVALGSGYERFNANGIDLESNWSSASPQPEVLALRGLFTRFLDDTPSVAVALNLHSDQYNGKRFFVTHAAAGTSADYTVLERRFVESVQAWFGAIEDWDFLTTWTGGTATRYPEGWWWTTRREQVLALTYEDDNSATSGRWDSTARALLLGAVDFLDGRIASAPPPPGPDGARTRIRIRQRRDGIDPGAGALRWRLRGPDGRLLGSGEISDPESILSWSTFGSRPGMTFLEVDRADGRTDRALVPPSRF